MFRSLVLRDTRRGSKRSANGAPSAVDELVHLLELGLADGPGVAAVLAVRDEVVAGLVGRRPFLGLDRAGGLGGRRPDRGDLLVGAVAHVPVGAREGVAVHGVDVAAVVDQPVALRAALGAAPLPVLE